MQATKVQYMPNKQSHLHHQKRRGHHHRRTKDYHKVYFPYLPLVIAIVISIAISGWRPTGRTLAYATNTTVSGLQQATNVQRSANGQVALTLSSKLNSAAQAKANDMVARNYWSHNTPDGQEPWIFIDATGYNYTKAGENLAYGFLDSDSTVNGWMNSPSHKANMLDGAFTDVGFGFANSSDFNNSGPETVVVAMYGRPQALGASSPEPTQPVAQAAPRQPAAVPSQKPTPVVQAQPAETTEPVDTPPPAQNQESKETVAFTSETPGLEPIEQPVTRVAAITGNRVPWATFGAGLIVGLAITAMLIKHGLAVRKLIANSERFVLHHPLFDSTVIGFTIVGITLLQTTGFIK